MSLARSANQQLLTTFDFCICVMRVALIDGNTEFVLGQKWSAIATVRKRRVVETPRRSSPSHSVPNVQLQLPRSNTLPSGEIARRDTDEERQYEISRLKALLQSKLRLQVCWQEGHRCAAQFWLIETNILRAV